MSAEEKTLRRELGRRRVYIFVSAWLLLALGGVINEESYIFLHALDEYVIFAIVIVAVLLFVLWRKKQSLPELKKQHKIIWILFAVALVFKIYAIYVEAGDPEDFGNEIPIFILLILTLVNRFI
jgi:dolichyl-phosphate-mannose--protein O-mannosyl transferase